MKVFLVLGLFEMIGILQIIEENYYRITLLSEVIAFLYSLVKSIRGILILIVYIFQSKEIYKEVKEMCQSCCRKCQCTRRKDKLLLADKEDELEALHCTPVHCPPVTPPTSPDMLDILSPTFSESEFKMARETLV